MIRQYTFLALALFTPHVQAQLSDKLFGIANESPGVWNFASYDVATQTLVALELMPFTGISLPGPSSSIDTENGVYYFCDGYQNMYSLDPYGEDPMVITEMPLPPGSYFGHTVFDPCDRVFYGLLYDYDDSITIARYDLLAQSFTTIHAFEPTVWPPTAPRGEFDATLRTYSLPVLNGWFGVNVETGETQYNTTLVPIPNEGFDHMALACGSGVQGALVYGTSIHASPMVKSLSRFSPYAGIISHVSDESTATGYWKPFTGGSCIDQQAGIFYWSGAGSVIMGFSMTTGEVVHEGFYTGGELHFIEHFSTCACLSTAVPYTAATDWSVRVDPDGAYVQVLAGPRTTRPARLSIFDTMGRSIRSLSVAAGDVVPIADLAAGCFLYRLNAANDATRSLASGKFVKN